MEYTSLTITGFHCNYDSLASVYLHDCVSFSVNSIQLKSLSYSDKFYQEIKSNSRCFEV